MHSIFRSIALIAATTLLASRPNADRATRKRPEIKVTIGILRYGEAFFNRIGPRMIRMQNVGVRTTAPVHASIPVVIENISTHPLDIFTQGNSWGDGTVQLIATMPDGRTHRFQIGPRAYSKNYPGFVRLDPGEVTQHDIPYETNGWIELHDFLYGLQQSRTRSFKLRAIFSQGGDLKTKDPTIWAGTVESPEIDISTVPT